MSAESYDPVPAAFGTKLNPNSVCALPPVNREQAAKIATLIQRRFAPPDFARIIHRPHNVRRVWLSSRPTMTANSAKGLGRLVHDLSHDVFGYYYPNKRAHDPLHARYEIEIAQWVGESARVFAILHPKPPAPVRKLTASEKRSRRLIATRDAIKRWESKQKRAATALRKLRARERGLERAMYEHDLRPLTVNGKPSWEQPGQDHSEGVL